MKLLLASVALLGGTASVASAFSAPTGSGGGGTALRMASGGRLPVRPIGMGSASPRTLITNADLESVHDTSDEWIRTRTGIRERRVLVHDGTRGVVGAADGDEHDDAEVPENLRALGIEAARGALSMSGVPPSEIDLVICATSSPDDLFGDAPTIADAVGCDPARVVAFDLTAACSGFLFGVVTASQYLGGGGSARNALVLGADALTRWVDWEDRNSCILFGDGAGAMVLTAGGEGEEREEGPKTISTPGKGTVVQDGSYDLMSMNGQKVYSFATREVPKVIQEALDKAGVKVEDVDHLLLHQGNIRIMKVVADQLGLLKEKVITNLRKVVGGSELRCGSEYELRKEGRSEAADCLPAPWLRDDKSGESLWHQ